MKKYAIDESAGYPRPQIVEDPNGEYVLETDHEAALAAEREQVEGLKKFQSVCECGSLCIDHTIGDGHFPVEMTMPCPFKEQNAALRQQLEQWKQTAGHEADGLESWRRKATLLRQQLEEAGQLITMLNDDKHALSRAKGE